MEPIRHRKSVAKRTKNAESPVAQLRLSLGLTQREFAVIMGVAPLQISTWERGASTPSGSAQRLLSIYRAHPELTREMYNVQGGAESKHK